MHSDSMCVAVGFFLLGLMLLVPVLALSGRGELDRCGTRPPRHMQITYPLGISG
jgi:hypothetical protein